MRKAVLLCVGLILMVASSSFVAQVAKANFVGTMMGLPNVVIQNDGTVVPQTDYIKQQGSLYTLTDDLAQKYALVINCSNIVFDGRGHCINGSNMIYWVDNWLGYNNVPITLEKVTNVTIQNVRTLGFQGYQSISISNCSKITISKVQTETGVYIQSSDYNSILNNAISLFLINSKHNTITNNEIELTLSGESSGSLFYANNFNYITYGKYYFRETGCCPLNSWDNGSVGNYWSDSIRNYSNTTQSSDQTLVIDGKNIDHYPISYPLALDLEIPIPTSASISVSPSPTVPEFPSILAIVFLFTATLTLTLAIRKKH